jgi:hypothetical protein
MLGLPLLLVACAGETPERDPELSPTAYRFVESAVERLAPEFPEATDTAVRDHVLVAVYCSLVEGKGLPAHFGMFSREANREVEAVVRGFVERAEVSLAGLTKHECIDAVWGDAWKRDYYVPQQDCERP